MPKTYRASAIRAMLLAMMCTLPIGAQVHGAGSIIYLPAVQAARAPCDAAAIAQLRAVSQWQGNFTITFKANASGTWVGGDSEVASVDHILRMNSLVLSKTTDSPTFVRWQVSQMMNTGQLVADDSDVVTSKLGGVSTMKAQFDVVAGTDVTRIILYPDQCKLRIELDAIAVGPVTGALHPEAFFTLCATIDVNTPLAGAQSRVASAPAYSRATAVSSFEFANEVGLRCRVGGGSSSIGNELFSSKVAWLLDGATTSGPRGKGDVPTAFAQLTYSFSPVP